MRAWIRSKFWTNWDKSTPPIKKVRFIFVLLPLKEGPNIGVGINSADGLTNAYKEYIWEPVLVKKNALIAATEVTIIINYKL